MVGCDATVCGQVLVPVRVYTPQNMLYKHNGHTAHIPTYKPWWNRTQQALLHDAYRDVSCETVQLLKSEYPFGTW